MTRYLITLSIGPVQEFIAAARRTADLFAGSSLLMNVVGAAAETFSAEERIFPADVTQGGANKILAVVESDPARYAQEAKKRAQEELSELWHEGIRGLEKYIDQNLAKKQLDSLLEVYAAWTPLDGDYSQARKRVEQLLGGRKALRDFTAIEQSDAGIPKSPLDPAFDCVFTGGVVPEALKEDRWKFKSSEVLDAVSLLKRGYGQSALRERLPNREILNTKTLAHRAKHP